MQQKFCGVFKYKTQMYVERHAYANGPRCSVFPPKPLYRGLTIEQLAQEIDSALKEYSSLGRPIYPQEWQEREEKVLAYFGERSISAMQRKIKDVTVRFDAGRNLYSLFDGRSGLVIAEVATVLDSARVIYERIGGPVTDPPAS